MSDKIKISQLQLETNLKEDSLIPIVQDNKTKAIKSKDLLKDLDGRIDSIYSQLEQKAGKDDLKITNNNVAILEGEKASKTELATERERIDVFSTELIDVRTDSGGNVYKKVGDHLRNIDCLVKSIFKDTEIINETITTSSKSFLYNFKVGRYYKISMECTTYYSLAFKGDGFQKTIILNKKDKTQNSYWYCDNAYTEVVVSSRPTGTLTLNISELSIDGSLVYKEVSSKLVHEEIESEFKNIYSAYFGDSITSDDVTGIGTRVAEILGCKITGNFAIGDSTCSDFHDNDTNLTEVDLSRPSNEYASINVLSNQVRRCLQYTSTLESQITWNHTIDGNFNIDTAKGVGLGNTDKIPNFIYIAIGTNDGTDSKTQVVDDTSTVFSQTYSQLTRLSLASALR